MHVTCRYLYCHCIRIVINFYCFQGKADGNKYGLWVRKHIQRYLYSIGCFIHLHCGKVLFVGLLLLSLCCVGLKSVRIETDVEKLWVEGKKHFTSILVITIRMLSVENVVNLPTIYSQILLWRPSPPSWFVTQKDWNSIMTVCGPSIFGSHRDVFSILAVFSSVPRYFLNTPVAFNSLFEKYFPINHFFGR